METFFINKKGRKMKSFILSSILIFTISLNIFAQNYAKKGHIETGASIAFTSTTAVFDGESTGDANNKFELIAPIHFFILDGFTIGFITTLEYNALGSSSTTGLQLGIGATYNFNKGSNLYPYLGCQLFYNYALQTAKNSDATLSGIGWSVIGGIKVQVTENVLINTAIGYSQRTLEFDDWKGDRIGSNIIALSSGFLFYF